MKSLALCSISSYAHWVLHEEESSTMLDSSSWSDDQSQSLSDQVKDQLESLLKRNHLQLNQIQKLYVFTGPGAFTSLRMSVSFILGLSKALNIPLKGIPSYQLYQRTFWIPTRHQLAKTMSFEECLESQMEFLEITSAEESQLKLPSEKNFTFGILYQAEWPSIEVISKAVLRESMNPNSPKEITINYGLNPKISGKR